MDKQSITEMLTNLQSALSNWWTPMMVIFYLVGFFVVMGSIVALVKSSKGGHSGQGGYSFSVVGIIIGSIIASLPTWLNTLSYTLFNQPSSSSLVDVGKFAGSGNGPEVAAALAVFFGVVQLVGLYGSVKGLLLFRDSFENREKRGPAFTHIIGGIIALNLPTFLSMIGVSIGGTVGSTIGHIIGA